MFTKAPIKRVAICLVVLAATIALAERAPATPDRLTTLATIKNITNAEAQRHGPVSFQATVTYYRSYEKTLFVQDGDAAIYVWVNAGLDLAPGDRVLVRGELRPSFRPYVLGNEVKLLGHGPLPKAVHATFEQMIRAETDCRLVTVRATVRSADLFKDPNYLTVNTYLRLLVDGENIKGTVDGDNQDAINGLLDAEVEITGVEAGQFDSKMEQVGVMLHIQSLNDVKVLKRSKSDPWSIPVTPMDGIIVGRKLRDTTERMRVHGTVTYYEPGQSMVLQDGSRSLRVATETSADVQVGDLADAIGFPDVENGFQALTQSEVRDDQVKAPIAPVLYRWKDLAMSGHDGLGHLFDLISIEGQVVTEVRQATQDQYVLQGDGHLFSAILRHPGLASRASLAPMEWIPVGSRIRVTGICVLEDANPFNGEVPFNILMRRFDDVEILTRPPWLNVTHLLYLIGVLLIVVVVVGARGWFIEHGTRRRTATMAHIEQRRGRILENMNNSHPLAEILDQITELVSYKLQGLPCWCEITGGDTIGNRPGDVHDPVWNVIEAVIPSNSSGPLGSLFVALVGRKPTVAEVNETMASSVGLASLAIENSHLHSDLVHRSEFDQLTDVRNRFSLEQALEVLIGQAGQSAGIFGLIYIDLDDFKQVNDRYGHLAGDIYLQEAAARMKRQLRPGDTLARLGGDEFAVLVPEVRNRAAVLEVAMRLEKCFEAAFRLDGPIVMGTASIGIALYPEDGNTKDGLLSAADVAMYEAKKARQRDLSLEMEPRRSSA
jgi:diguanylate cyclase (GGDEF)-like protein